MMPNVNIRPLSDLPAALPVLVSAMSMSRANMVIDQLKSLVGRARIGEIVFITCDPSESDPSDCVALQAGVVVFHPANADFATMFVAGWTNKTGGNNSVELSDQQTINPRAQLINDVLEPLLFQRGVRFLQYATDVIDSGSIMSRPCGDVSSWWAMGLGFHHLGNLEYQSGSTDGILDRLGHDEPRRVVLRPVSEIAQFAKVVELTYQQTMDCPGMSKFRNAQETLCGYQHTDAFDPAIWFSVHHVHDNARDSDRPIGCLILGTHQNQHAVLHQDELKEAVTTVIGELVYMGLVPEARGLGLGKEVLKHAAMISQNLGVQQMILAVDEANHPARELYRHVGMMPMMRESVWVKRIELRGEV